MAAQNVARTPSRKRNEMNQKLSQQNPESFDLMEAAGLLHVQAGSRHKSYDVLVTPTLAEEILSKHNYKGQRPINKAHVGELAEYMETGYFREYTSINFMVIGGVPILVNGQHTMSAVVLSKKPLWLNLQFDRAANDSEIEAAYSTFDVQRRRTAIDVMGTIGEELGLPKKERDVLNGAVAFVELGFRPISGKDSAKRKAINNNFELKKDFMRAWGNEARLYFDCIATGPAFNKQPMTRKDVVAVGLVTLREQPDKAIDFWKGAALDNGLINGDPRKTLINWLKSNKASGDSVNLQHRSAIACWNAWFEGRQLHKVMPRSDSSLTILGTQISIASGARKAVEE